MLQSSKKAFKKSGLHGKEFIQTFCKVETLSCANLDQFRAI